MPWILCGPGSPPESTGELFGSTATTCRSGLRSFSRSPAPVIVPPVPTPATSTSTLPSVSRQISSAVVRRWISGLAGLPNWSGMKQLPRSLGDRLGGLDRLVHAAHRLGDLHLGAVEPQQPLALAAHALRHREHEVVAARRAHERQRDPGVARRRLDDRRGARLDLALGLGGVDHRHADPVLDAAGRVVGLELAEQLGAAVRGQAGQPDHRRVADEVGQVVRDRPHRRGDAHPLNYGPGGRGQGRRPPRRA